jgi:DNA-3-methyladenine glycosylase
MRRRELRRAFFAADTLEVAPALLGCILSFDGCEGVIVETEAYKTDAASHIRTRRHQGRALAETWGEIYVYLNYGMYHLLNVTTEKHGVGAVLIRAVEPTAGIELMQERRGTNELRRLASGPGKLCRAFAIDLRQHARPVGEAIRFFDRPGAPEIVRGPRVGISRDTHLPWRFWIAGSPFVSGAGPRGPRRG